MVDGFLTHNDAGLRSVLTTRSQIYRLLSNMAHRMGIGRGTQTLRIERQLMNPRAWESEDLAEAYRGYRREMAAICDSFRARDLSLLVVVIPPHAVVDEVLREQLVMEGRAAGEEPDPHFVVERAVAVFEGLGIDYVDATPVLAEIGREAFFRFDGDLRPHASRAVGELLGARLREISWAKLPTRVAQQR